MSAISPFSPSITNEISKQGPGQAVHSIDDAGLSVAFVGLFIIILITIMLTKNCNWIKKNFHRSPLSFQSYRANNRDVHYEFVDSPIGFEDSEVENGKRIRYI